MMKQEFLEILRQALNGRVASEQITENMRFYEDYINTEVRKGKSEEEVLAALGDPRLIARTIVETNGGQGRQSAEFYGGSGGQYEYDRGENQEYGRYGQSERMPRRFLVRLPAWIWLILLILLVVLVLGAVFSVLAAILPVLLPILLVLFLVRIFRDWMN